MSSKRRSPRAASAGVSQATAAAAAAEPEVDVKPTPAPQQQQQQDTHHLRREQKKTELDARLRGDMESWAASRPDAPSAASVGGHSSMAEYAHLLQSTAAPGGAASLQQAYPPVSMPGMAYHPGWNQGSTAAGVGSAGAAMPTGASANARPLLACDDCSKQHIGNTRLMWCGLLPRSEIESKRCDVCSIPLDEQKAQQELAVRKIELEKRGVEPGRFECRHPSCFESFKRGDRLLAHSQTHTGEKPFVCDVCWRAYSRKDRLNTHMKRHKAGSGAGAGGGGGRPAAQTADANALAASYPPGPSTQFMMPPNLLGAYFQQNAADEDVRLPPATNANAGAMGQDYDSNSLMNYFLNQQAAGLGMGMVSMAGANNMGGRLPSYPDAAALNQAQVQRISDAMQRAGAGAGGNAAQQNAFDVVQNTMSRSFAAAMAHRG